MRGIGIINEGFGAMPIWSLIVNSILWAISICLAGFSIRFIIKGIRGLAKTKYSKYADDYEAMLQDNKTMLERYEEIIKGYQNIISETEEMLNKGIESMQSELSDHLEGYYRHLEEVTKDKIENLELQMDIHKKISQMIDQGGIRGFYELNQIEATKNIALGAVLIAFSSVGFSISSAILSVVK